MFLFFYFCPGHQFYYGVYHIVLALLFDSMLYYVGVSSWSFKSLIVFVCCSWPGWSTRLIFRIVWYGERRIDCVGRIGLFLKHSMDTAVIFTTLIYLGIYTRLHLIVFIVWCSLSIAIVSTVYTIRLSCVIFGADGVLRVSLIFSVLLFFSFSFFLADFTYFSLGLIHIHLILIFIL